MCTSPWAICCGPVGRVRARKQARRWVRRNSWKRPLKSDGSQQHHSPRRGLGPMRIQVFLLEMLLPFVFQSPPGRMFVWAVSHWVARARMFTAPSREFASMNGCWQHAGLYPLLICFPCIFFLIIYHRASFLFSALLLLSVVCAKLNTHIQLIQMHINTHTHTILGAIIKLSISISFVCQVDSVFVHLFWLLLLNQLFILRHQKLLLLTRKSGLVGVGL